MTTIQRLPTLFLAAGLVLKGLLVLTWRLFRIPELLGLLTTYDPGAFWLAEKTTALIFDQRRIAPSSAETIAFELLLIVGFGIECLLLGLLIRWFLRRPNRAAGHTGSRSAVPGR